MEHGSRVKTVWVLGAGFSRPLGGPLLHELFGPQSIHDIVCAFPTFPIISSKGFALVGELYQLGRGRECVYDHLREKAMPFWGHAEEFLEKLDLASLAESQAEEVKEKQVARRAATLLNTLVFHAPNSGSSLAQLAADARRRMAAECCSFMRYAITSTEKWTPYRQWLSQLGSNDTIVTFNYDLVLETLVRDYELTNVSIVLPCMKMNTDCSNVYKLHGSVNWKRIEHSDGSVSIELAEDDYFALTCVDHEIAIGSPGPKKFELMKPLSALWRHAEDALERAERIVFIGYRFPESDAEAKRRLLGAINRHRLTTSKIEIVLGPKTGEEDVIRLNKMLETVRPDIKPVVHPLWAEDFLALEGRTTRAHGYSEANIRLWVRENIIKDRLDDTSCSPNELARVLQDRFSSDRGLNLDDDSDDEFRWIRGLIERFARQHIGQ